MFHKRQLPSPEEKLQLQFAGDNTAQKVFWAIFTKNLMAETDAHQSRCFYVEERCTVWLRSHVALVLKTGLEENMTPSPLIFR